MKRFALAVICCALATSALAAPKPCEELKAEIEQTLGAPIPHLSMGMSHDFETAIEEGATMVRVGTAIFGERIPLAKQRGTDQPDL